MMATRAVVLWTVLAICVMLELAEASPLHIRDNDKVVQDKGQQPRMVNHPESRQEEEFITHSRLERSPQPVSSAPAVSAAMASVCDRLCNCSKENEIFINIVCDFTQNEKYVLDDQTLVPNVTRTFHVNLGRNAQLFIREKVFRRTILNRISVNGGQAGGRQEVNFGPRAFHDNRAPFPEIDLNNAQTLTIHGNAFHGEFKLNVGNVENVIVQANAFQNTTFIGNFRAVENLRFEKDAFLGTKDSQIQISDTNIGLLERMDATMQEIKLKNCRIDAIRQNTFDVLSISSIVFEDCDINVIESNFTTGKLLSDYLGIIGCRIGRIQSNAIAHSGFSVVQIERNTIESIESHAISANAITLSMAHNIIPKTAEGWLVVREWSNVTIFNNSFGHFDLIDVQGGGQQCQFNRNSITQWTENSLSKMSPTCQFHDNLFASVCTCSLEWLEKLSRSNGDLKRTSYCQIDTALRHCFNASSFNVQTYYDTVCSESAKAIDCRKTMSEKKVDANFVDPNDFSGHSKRYEHFIYLLVGIACLCILLIVVIVIVIRLRCQRKVGGVPRSNNLGQQLPSSRQGTLAASTLNKSIKTFSVSDRMIVDLAMEKLREKYPQDVYEQIDKYTKRLTQEPLSETEKVLTIGEIVRILDECENIGEDFLAFTDILYKHLDETNNIPPQGAMVQRNAGDPVYAEPGMMGGMIEPMTTILTTNLDSDNHIYAEPNSAQQPLLKTEYSLPLDRSDLGTNVYAEPVEARNDKSSRLVSPYAIGSPSSNLPDVLSRSVAVAAAAAATTSPPPIPVPKMNTFGKSPSGVLTTQPPPSSNLAMPGTSRAAMPMYSIPQKSSNPQVPLQRDNSSSSNSNHSGGSDITFKIDDIIDYADS